MRLAIVIGCAVSLAAIGCASTDAPPAGTSPVDGIRTPFYVALLVEDVDRAAAWYRETIPLEPAGESFADDGSWRILNLVGDGLHVELIRDARSEPARRDLGLFKVGFAVPDVEIVAARLAATGRERPRIVDDTTHGIRILQLRDPEGNVLQLASPLAGRD